jgi:serine/threonine protein kinase
MTSGCGPTLKTLLADSGHQIPESMAIDVLIQLLNRLEKIHLLGVIHGNVCPSSLRIDIVNNYKVYLCNFY